MTTPVKLTISRELGFAIEVEAKWWFFDDSVLSDTAAQLADAIEKYGDRIAKTTDEMCKTFGSTSWHGDESPDEHLQKLAAFARRSGYETKHDNESFSLIARSDEDMVPHMKFIDIEDLCPSAPK